MAKKGSRIFSAGLAAAFLLSCSPLALHAEVSNAELAKEIAELKAQLRSLKGGVAEAKKEARSKKTTVVAAPAPVYIPPAIAALPPGATPVFATADKKLIFGNLTITPGGFLDANGFFRTRNLQSDVTSNFNAIPTNNNNLAHVNEARFSIRQSRAALLIESPISKSMIVSGYGEFDLNAAGTNSNMGQTNSFVPRVRHAYMALDNSDYGMHFLAGQTWSLITTNSKGITPRNEVIPAVNDSGIVPGFDYGRIPQVRLVKDFDKKLWIAIDAELAQTQGINGCGNVVSNTAAAATVTPSAGTATTTATNTGAVATALSVPASAVTGISGGTCLAPGSGSFGGTGTNQQFSLNKVPDVIGKIAYEARIANRDVHVEGLGIYKDTLSYVNYGTAAATTGFPFSTQKNAAGYGVGGGVVAAIIPTKLDFQGNAEYGRGLGRYTSTGLPDATLTGDGIVHPLLGFSAMVGLVAHLTPSFDVYGYAGLDQVNRQFNTIGGAQIGYGLTIGSNNTGCNVVGGTCTGVTHRVSQLTGGVVDKLYKGYFGEVRANVQYSFTERQLFGSQAAAGAAFTSARADEHIVFTSLRYYPFQ